MVTISGNKAAGMIGVSPQSIRRWCAKLKINSHAITYEDLDKLSEMKKFMASRVFYRVSVMDWNSCKFYVKRAGLERRRALAVAENYRREGMIARIHRCDGKKELIK